MSSPLTAAVAHCWEQGWARPGRSSGSREVSLTALAQRAASRSRGCQGKETRSAIIKDSETL